MDDHTPQACSRARIRRQAEGAAPRRTHRPAGRNRRACRPPPPAQPTSPSPPAAPAPASSCRCPHAPPRTPARRAQPAGTQGSRGGVRRRPARHPGSGPTAHTRTRRREPPTRRLMCSRRQAASLEPLASSGGGVEAAEAVGEPPSRALSTSPRAPPSSPPSFMPASSTATSGCPALASPAGPPAPATCFCEARRPNSLEGCPAALGGRPPFAGAAGLGGGSAQKKLPSTISRPAGQRGDEARRALKRVASTAAAWPHHGRPAAAPARPCQA